MENKLLLATNNAHKVREIREILHGKFSEILTLSDIGIEVDVDEDGDTFLANALKKAREVHELTGYITLADDTGLVVNALGGEPGVKSARYAKEHDDMANNEKLLLNLNEKDDRAAKFITCVVLYSGDKYVYAEGEVKGEILRAPLGKNGFGYDSLFYSYDIKKTFGQATDEEKNLVSHRARALNNLLKKL